MVGFFFFECVICHLLVFYELISFFFNTQIPSLALSGMRLFHYRTRNLVTHDTIQFRSLLLFIVLRCPYIK